MTKDDIIRMAREAGLSVKPPSWGYTDHYHFAGFEQPFERFAALVAAAEQKKWFDQTEVEIHEAVLDEREACAKVCDEESMEERDDWANGWLAKAWDCARAIRARSDK